MNIKFMIPLTFVLLAFPFSIFADVQTTTASQSSPEAIHNSATPATPTSSVSPASPAKFTNSEKIYLIQAYRYMAIEQESGLMIANEVSKLAAGRATIENLGDTVKAALSGITAAHNAYSQISVPPKYVDLDSQINNIYAQFSSGYSEMLKYWIDGNLAHIDNAPLDKAAVEQRKIFLEITDIIGKDQLQY